MNKINVANFTEADLKALTTNARRVFNEQLGLDLSLNQLRHRVAQLFGAKSWQSLTAAAASIPSTTTAEPCEQAWVGVREVFGNGYDPETRFTQRFAGATEDAVYEQIGRGLCLETFREMLADRSLDDGDIDETLAELQITPERIAVITPQLSALSPDARYDADHLFTGREIVTAYLDVWGDEESIVVERLDLARCSQPTAEACAVEPA
jgi:hypothetical protein